MLVGRAIVIYGLLGGSARGPETEQGLPRGWLHALFWAGLRGAVAVALALSLPETIPQRSLLQAITFGIVLFTLIVQGGTIRWVVSRGSVRVGWALNRRKTEAGPPAGSGTGVGVEAGSADAGRSDDRRGAGCGRVASERRHQRRCAASTAGGRLEAHGEAVTRGRRIAPRGQASRPVGGRPAELHLADHDASRHPARSSTGRPARREGPGAPSRGPRPFRWRRSTTGSPRAPRRRS